MNGYDIHLTGPEVDYIGSLLQAQKLGDILKADMINLYPSIASQVQMAQKRASKAAILKEVAPAGNGSSAGAKPATGGAAPDGGDAA